MDKHLALKLVKARKNVRRKLEGLKEDIRASNLEFQRKLEPIAAPIKKLLAEIKLEGSIKKEDQFITRKREFTTSTPETKKFQTKKPKRDYHQPLRPTELDFSGIETAGLPERSVQFLSNRDIASYQPETIRSDDDDTIREIEDLPPSAEIRNLIETYKHSEVFQDYLDQYSGLSREYIEGCITDTKNEFDHVFGVRFFPDDGTFRIGDSQITFDGNDFYLNLTHLPEPILYKGTVGLFELIFKRKPQGFDLSDLREYQDIARKTNLLHKEYISKNPLNYNQSYKYIRIIKKIQKPLPAGNISYTTPRIRTRQYQKQQLQREEPEAATPAKIAPKAATSKTIPTYKGGGSSSLTKTSLTKNKNFKDKYLRTLDVSNKTLEFVPWSNPNTLVDRLRILISSQVAGNNSHSNEIYHIIEALRKARIMV